MTHPQSQPNTNAWVMPYALGVVVFSFGMGFSFGIPGILIAGGAVCMLGGFGQFLLTKIAALTGGGS